MATRVIRRDPDTGVLQMLDMPEKTADRISSDSNRVEAYFNASLSEASTIRDQGILAYKRFIERMNQIKCFYCEDMKYHNVPIETKIGLYTFSFACICNDIGASSKITELTNKNFYQLGCVLGGSNGSLCPLTRKDSKCFGFKCPKFS